MCLPKPRIPTACVLVKKSQPWQAPDRAASSYERNDREGDSVEGGLSLWQRK